MAIQFEVNTQRLNSDIAQSKACLNYINTNLKSMFDEIRELDTMWDGEANNAFNVQFANDYDMMLEVIKELRALIDSLEFSRNEYVRCENQVSAAINSMKF